MAFVKLKDGETFEQMMRRFKKQVLKENIVQELRKREFYVPPSEKRRKKSEAARKKLKKLQAKYNKDNDKD